MRNRPPYVVSTLGATRPGSAYSWVTSRAGYAAPGLVVVLPWPSPKSHAYCVGVASISTRCPSSVTVRVVGAVLSVKKLVSKLISV